MRSTTSTTNHHGEMFPTTKFGDKALLTFRLLLRDNAAKGMRCLMENSSLDKGIFLR
jgi:hypothetical protein